MLATYPAGQRQQSTGRARVVQITAPTGGWNTRDSVAEMAPTDAIVLENWIPGVGKVEARKGYTTLLDAMHTDLGGAWAADNIETLIPFKYGTSEKFLACHDGGISDISTGTAVEVKARATYTVDRWQHTIFADSSAPNTPKVIAVNGTDTPWTYDGTTHAAWAPTASSGSFTAANFIWIQAWKNRLFVGEKNTRDFWYGALGTLPGSMTRFPLSGVRGAQGNILFMTSLTRDTGDGPDDFAVFVTDAGSVIVYSGTDPSDATKWELVGVYQIPRPIPSRRAYAKLFGDVIIATDLDYVSLGESLQTSGAVVLNPSKLCGAVQEAARRYRDVYGWEMVPIPREGLILCQIPREANAQYDRHVINMQTKAGARLTGWHFRTCAVWAGNLYGAGNDEVFRLFSGYIDDADGAEDRIPLRAQSAWTDAEFPGAKWVKAIRPIMRAQGTLQFNASLGVDFRDPQVLAVPTDGPAAASTLWGDTSGVTTLWGDTAATTTYWAGGTSSAIEAAQQWRLNGARGTHFCVSLAMDAANQRIEWLGTAYKLAPVGRY